MKKTESKKKLTLKRETVRTLTPKEQSDVAGGSGIPKQSAFWCVPPPPKEQ
jgi:hypothetical protein